MKTVHAPVLVAHALVRAAPPLVAPLDPTAAYEPRPRERFFSEFFPAWPTMFETVNAWHFTTSIEPQPS